MSAKSHWEEVYRTKSPDQVSWYRPHLDVSLRLIAEAAPSRDSALIDVGGGEATLVDDLVAQGYGDISVLDISEGAIEVAKARLGDAAVFPFEEVAERLGSAGCRPSIRFRVGSRSPLSTQSGHP